MAANLERALEIPVQSSMFVHDLRWLAERASTCRRIVELGSYHGRSARAMLDSSRARLWCVDCWDLPPGHSGRDVSDADLRVFLENVGDVRDRVVVLKMRTDEAAGLLPEGCFDMVFIDACHRYECVKADILNFAPLLRPGGTLCGHDYGKGREGVIRAVDELVAPAHLHTLKGGVMWWAVRMPGWLRVPLEAGHRFSGWLWDKQSADWRRVPPGETGSEAMHYVPARGTGE